jgi:hypothetical protein
MITQLVDTETWSWDISYLNSKDEFCFIKSGKTQSKLAAQVVAQRALEEYLHRNSKDSVRPLVFNWVDLGA